jgi:hypothetical protein
MRGIRSDLRQALRSLRKTPGFSLAVVAALALGIGPNTAIFSIVHATLLEPLPFPEPEQLVRVWSQVGGKREGTSPADFRAWRQQATSFQYLEAFWPRQLNLASTEAPERVRARQVSPDGYRMFGEGVWLGRDFAADEDQPGKHQVALVSHRLWKRQGGDPAMVGREIRLDSKPYLVIGVLPPGPQDRRPADLWIPLSLTPDEIANRLLTRMIWNELGRGWLSLDQPSAPSLRLGNVNGLVGTTRRGQSAFDLLIQEEDVARPDSFYAEVSPGIGRTDVGEAISVFVDDVAFVGIEGDCEDAPVHQGAQLGAGGAAVVIAVGPEQEGSEPPVTIVDIAVVIAAIDLEVQLAQGDIAVCAGLAVGQPCHVAEQLVSVIDLTVVIAVEGEKRIVRSGCGPGDLLAYAVRIDVELHALVDAGQVEATMTEIEHNRTTNPGRVVGRHQYAVAFNDVRASGSRVTALEGWTASVPRLADRSRQPDFIVFQITCIPRLTGHGRELE